MLGLGRCRNAGDRLASWSCFAARGCALVRRGERVPITLSRWIGAPAGEIFQVLANPGRHRDFDGSGMLRGWCPARRPAGWGCLRDEDVLRRTGRVLDVHLALQMSSQHISGQRQVVPFLMRDPALPSAAYRREPALPSRTGVLDPGSVDVGTCREQRPEERHLRVIGRVLMDRSRRCLEEAGLRRTGCRGLPRAHLQHLQAGARSPPAAATAPRPQPRESQSRPHHMHPGGHLIRAMRFAGDVLD